MEFSHSLEKKKPLLPLVTKLQELLECVSSNKRKHYLCSYEERQVGEGGPEKANLLSLGINHTASDPLIGLNAEAERQKLSLPNLHWELWEGSYGKLSCISLKNPCHRVM